MTRNLDPIVSGFLIPDGQWVRLRKFMVGGNGVHGPAEAFIKYSRYLAGCRPENFGVEDLRNIIATGLGRNTKC